jgi:hypothetical protein
MKIISARFSVFAPQHSLSNPTHAALQWTLILYTLTGLAPPLASTSGQPMGTTRKKLESKKRTRSWQ